MDEQSRKHYISHQLYRRTFEREIDLILYRQIGGIFKIPSAPDILRCRGTGENGVAPVISFNYGARCRLRLKNLYRICLRFIAASSAGIFLASLLFGPRLVALFAGSETIVYDIAVPGFILFSFSFLFSGMNYLLILPALNGVNGVWPAVPVAKLLTFGVSAYFLYSCRAKYSLGG